MHELCVEPPCEKRGEVEWGGRGLARGGTHVRRSVSELCVAESCWGVCVCVWKMTFVEMHI